ncbi:MAG TPA: hypothetical protein VGM68_00445 [Rhizomicrobium sp.]|jgi:hypothetical protein
MRRTLMAITVLGGLSAPTLAFAQYSAGGTVDLGNAYGGAAAMMGPASLANSTLCLSSPVFCPSGKSSSGAAQTGSGSGISPGLAKRVQDAVMPILTEEYKRRSAAEGPETAKAWYMQAARDVAGQTGRLMPEYRKRIASEGSAKADSWYLSSAQDLGNKYVRAHGAGPSKR